MLPHLATVLAEALGPQVRILWAYGAQPAPSRAHGIMVVHLLKGQLEERLFDGAGPTRDETCSSRARAGLRTSRGGDRVPPGMGEGGRAGYLPKTGQ